MSLSISTESRLSDPAVVVLQAFDLIAGSTKQPRTSVETSSVVEAESSGSPAAARDTIAEEPFEGCAYCGDDVPGIEVEFCSSGCARMAALED